MSFGTDTAADPTAASGFAAGQQYAGTFGPPGGGAQGQQSWMDQLKSVLKDPEVQKALGDAAKHFGNMNTALNKLSPQAQQVIKQGLSGGAGGGGGPLGGKPSTGSGAVQTKPYMGDMPDFSAEHAQDVLRSLGIPFGGR